MNLFYTLDFNNREIAIGIWLLIVTVIAFGNNSLRKSILTVLRSALHIAIIIPLIFFIAYTGIMAFGLLKIGFWELPNMKETILWFSFVGLAMFINANEATRSGFFRNIILAELKIIVGLGVFEFLVDFFVLDLWAELILVPLLFILGAMLGVASSYSKYKAVELLLSRIISIIGVGVVVFLLYKVATDLNSLLTLATLREFLLPSIFTIGSLPYIYLLALYLTYDRIFNVLSYYSGKKRNTGNKLRIIIAFHINLFELRNWQSHIGRSRGRGTVNIKDNLKEYKSRRNRLAKFMKRVRRGAHMNRFRRDIRRNRRIIIRSIATIGVSFLGLLTAIHFWRLSTPEIFWPALEAIIIAIASIVVIFEIRAFQESQLERGVRGFFLFAENYLWSEFPEHLEMLKGALKLPENERARDYDVYALQVLTRLEIAQTFIDRGLMDREIFFLSYSGELTDAALIIRHLRHHPKKMPWMIEREAVYRSTFNLLRDVEDWNADRGLGGQYDD